LHIAVLIDYLDMDHLGGAETSVLLICRELLRLQHRVTIITAGPFREQRKVTDVDGMKVHSIIAKPAGLLADYTLVSRPDVIRTTVEILQRLQPDLVQTHVIHNYFSFGVIRAIREALPEVRIVPTLHDHSVLCKGALRCKRERLLSTKTLDELKMPSIATCWLCQKHTFNPFKRHQILDILNNHCDTIVFVSDDLRRFFVANGLETPTQVIYNGVKLVESLRSADVAQQFLRKYQLGDFQLAICGGRMKPIKGYHTVVEALPEIVQHAKEPTLLVVYGGKNNYSNSLEQRAKALGVSDYLRVMDWLSKDELTTLLSVSSVGIVPSIYPDPLPRTTFEYMVQGLPIVATTIGGAKEVVQDGQNGFLVNPWDAGDMATKITRILNSPQLRDEMRQQAYCTLVSSFQTADLSQIRINLYKRLLGETP
jgi:glycosyltransferase involved in cell wall biosynthesis